MSVASMACERQQCAAVQGVSRLWQQWQQQTKIGAHVRHCFVILRVSIYERLQALVAPPELLPGLSMLA